MAYTDVLPKPDLATTALDYIANKKFELAS